MEQQNGSLWADTLKKEVIEYTVDRKRDREMTTVLENVRTVLEDVIERVDTDNSLKNFWRNNYGKTLEQYIRGAINDRTRFSLLYDKIPLIVCDD